MRPRELVAEVVDLGLAICGLSWPSLPSRSREVRHLAFKGVRPFLISFLALGAPPSAASAQDASGLACAELRADVSRILATEPVTLQVNDLLFEASRKGCASLLETLEKAGASPLARDRRGDDALILAARMGRESMVEALLGADKAVRDVELDRPNVAGTTPLIAAALAGRTAVAKRLIEAGAKVDVANAQGETALSAAAFDADFDLVSLLLARGAKPDTIDHAGKSPILYAAARGSDRIVAALIDVGVDVNARRGSDLTALMWAAGHADNAPADAALRTVRLLIARGAKLDFVDDRGRSALMIAAALGHAEIVKALIAAGADRSLKDRTAKTARDLAGSSEIEAILASP